MNKKTYVEKLRTFANRKRVFTHKEAVEYLLSRAGREYNEKTRTHFDPLLYGNFREETGFLWNECRPTVDQFGRRAWEYRG